MAREVTLAWNTDNRLGATSYMMQFRERFNVQTFNTSPPVSACMYVCLESVINCTGVLQYDDCCLVINERLICESHFNLTLVVLTNWKSGQKLDSKSVLSAASAMRRQVDRQGRREGGSEGARERGRCDDFIEVLVCSSVILFSVAD